MEWMIQWTDKKKEKVAVGLAVLLCLLYISLQAHSLLAGSQVMYMGIFPMQQRSLEETGQAY